MALALTGFSVLAGGVLGWVNGVTAEPIAQANAKILSDAIKVVVPDFDNNPAEASETIEIEGATYKVYKATKSGEFVGAAVESASMGFGGDLRILVGFTPEGKIVDYSVLAHAETPGLGSKAAEWFKKGAKGDITGMNPGEKELVVSKDGGQVDAITASTITSRAFLLAVNKAFKAFKSLNTESVATQDAVASQVEAATENAEQTNNETNNRREE